MFECWTDSGNKRLKTVCSSWGQDIKVIHVDSLDFYQQKKTFIVEKKQQMKRLKIKAIFFLRFEKKTGEKLEFW